jgi:protoporphyrinogen oxidase
MTIDQSFRPSVICIGAGPAGLTAAYTLTKAGAPVTVLESHPHLVGGISRTVAYRGFHFDIGGHRFFSKSAEVEALWDEILGEDFLERPRKSRIFYRGKLFDYPLKGLDALRKLGLTESLLCVLSYAKARLRPVREPQNFEDWVTNQFGGRLFRIFFKTYTEKVWGMDCRDISADWAAQRIKGLSLARAILHALRPAQRPAARGAVVKTLIDRFRYPRRGPGMMWEAAARKIRAGGGRVLLGLTVTNAAWDARGRRWQVTAVDAEGRREIFTADHVVSSTSIRALVGGLLPPPSPQLFEAAASLRYRDFIVVALVVRERGVFDDNWIYIHDPEVKVGRIQNFKSWSSEMVPDQSLTCYGLEYFCFEHDDLWSSSDAALIALAQRELVSLGLAELEDILDASVVRQPKAYPVYDDEYQRHVATVRQEIERHYPALHLVGRNGMHKYNNQDHAMMTALLTARNILAGALLYDVWQVNQDAEYHEAGKAGSERSPAASGERLVPARVGQGAAF